MISSLSLSAGCPEEFLSYFQPYDGVLYEGETVMLNGLSRRRVQGGDMYAILLFTAHLSISL